MSRAGIERQIQAKYVALRQQRIKVDILGPFCIFFRELVAIVVDNPHPKHFDLSEQVLANAAQPEDSQHFALWIVAQRSWRDFAEPLFVPNCHDPIIEPA